jgi:hypothetical protein
MRKHALLLYLFHSGIYLYFVQGLTHKLSFNIRSSNLLADTKCSFTIGQFAIFLQHLVNELLSIIYR